MGGTDHVGGVKNCWSLFCFLSLTGTVLSPVEFEALNQAGSKLATLTPEELQKMRDDGG